MIISVVVVSEMWEFIFSEEPVWESVNNRVTRVDRAGETPSWKRRQLCQALPEAVWTAEGVVWQPSRRRPLLSRLSARRNTPPPIDRWPSAIFQGSFRVSWHSSDARCRQCLPLTHSECEISAGGVARHSASVAGWTACVPAPARFHQFCHASRRNAVKEIAKITSCLAIS